MSGVCSGRASRYCFALFRQASKASGVAFTTTLSVSVPLAANLVAWYPLDETAGTLQDASGNSRHVAALTGVTLDQEGLAGGKAVLFTPNAESGMAAFFEIPDFPVLQTLSVSLWAQATGEFPTGIGTLFSKIEGEGVGEEANSPYSLALFSTFDNALGWIVAESPEAFGVSATTPLTEPTHIVLTHEDGNGADAGASVTRLYLNGELAGEMENSPGFVDVLDRFQVGARASANGFHGLIDDVQLYSRALTQEEARQLFEKPGLPIGVDPDNMGGGGEDPLTDLEDVGISEAGNFRVTVPSGVTAEIEYSLDLLMWEVIATDQNGTFEETDAERLAAPSGYYRAKR